jgi:hypothetical protein
MAIRSLSLSTVIVAVVALGFVNGQPNPARELNPQTVTFSAERLPLRDALEQLRKQTGNAIGDARANPTNDILSLPKKPLTFWQALDAIGKDTGIGHSPYQADGGVALVDRTNRPQKTDYNGLFRFAFKGITLSRDEETQAHLCKIQINVAWEPRLRLLFLNLEEAELMTPRRDAVSRQPARNVAGTSAADIELTANAPPRAQKEILALKGKLRAVGAPKTLEFEFAKFAGSMSQSQDGVKVSAKVVSQTVTRWSIDVEAEHSKDAVIKVQSFEEPALREFLYQRVWLTWTDARTRKTHVIEKSGEADSQRTTGVVYTFLPKTDAPLPPPDADVTLHFRTPNRVVPITAAFSFQNLPLP